MKSPRYWIAVAVTAFLAPILGGQMVLDVRPISPGGLVPAIFSETQGASTAHLLVALPVLGVLVLALLRRHVQQLPQTRIAGFIAVFMLFAWGSVAMSPYRTVSLATAFEWTAMILAFFAVVGLAGRQRGPVAILAALVGGVAVISLLGIREYVSQPDPTWRIFANWINPNALAGLLPFGILGGLGLFATTQDRLSKVLAGLGVVLPAIALFLSQSKGGLLAFGVGLIVLLAWWIVQGGTARVKLAGTASILPVLGIALAIGLTSAQRAKVSAAGPALGRLAQASNTQEQSAGFRSMLWRTAGELTKDQPIGRGFGTFRFNSSRPGIIPQTHTAHQSILQLASEVGIIGLGALLLAVVILAVEGLRGVKSLPDEVRILRGAVYAALGAAVVHNMIDSDLYVFGTGILFFMLCGVLLQLSPDGSNPEFAQKPLRWITAGATVLTLIGMLFTAVVDLRLGGLRHQAGVQDPNTLASFSALEGLASNDYRYWSLGARLTSDSREKIQRLENSIAVGPTIPALRQLAFEKDALGDLVGAQRALNDALRLDPNNLPTLFKLVLIHEKTDLDRAKETARRLIEVESKPYFTVRALPELVPTETFEAREWLADRTSDPKERSELLKGAIDGYVSYAQQTVPQVVVFAKAGIDGDYAGVTRDLAHASLTRALELLKTFESLDSTQSAWASESRAKLQEALDSLG